MTKTALDPKEIDYILGGNVIQEVRTANIAREAAMAAGRYICMYVCMYVCNKAGIYVCMWVGRYVCR